MLVGVGYPSTEIEIIDLESSASTCSNLKDFPEETIGPIGGLELDNNPVICGGFDSSGMPKQDCFSWKDSEKRGYASSCPSPFPKESHKLLVAGGNDGTGQHFHVLIKMYQ